MRLSDNTQKAISPDFIPRSYSKPIKELSLIYVLAIGLIFAVLHFKDMIGGDIVATVIITTTVLLIAVYTILKRQQHNDQMMATEFENLLFSAAASLGSTFCLFIKHDGTIVYANDGTRKMFPTFKQNENQSLEELLYTARVERSHIDKLFSTVARATKETIIFPITDSAGYRSDYVVTVDPLKRPSGYFVVKGREYYTERTSVAVQSTNMQKSSPESIAALCAHLPFPVYITNSSGVLEYVNKPLEALLDYVDGSMINEELTIQKLVYHADGYETAEFEMTGYSGNVMLSKRNQQLVKAYLNQTLIYDSDKKITGICGYILE